MIPDTCSESLIPICETITTKKKLELTFKQDNKLNDKRFLEDEDYAGALVYEKETKIT